MLSCKGRRKTIAGAVMVALAAVSFTPTPASAATATTTLVSVTSEGILTSGNGSSTGADVTPDGRYVAFQSNASNLVARPFDTNAQSDVFLHDRTTRVTSLVSKAIDGTLANGASSVPSISADGRYIAFVSSASNLVAGDTNTLNDVFVRDLTTGTTSRVSVTNAGGQGQPAGPPPISPGGSGSPDISADGRYVAFASTVSMDGSCSNCTEVYVHDRQTGTSSRASVPDDASQSAVGGVSGTPSISADGRFVAFDSTHHNLVSGDTNGIQSNPNNGEDVFVRDRTTADTFRVSVASGGTQSDNSSRDPSISATGRYIAFTSRATNLVSGDTNGQFDIFLHDRTTGATTRASVASGGAQADSSTSDRPSISADGRYVAFSTNASNLVSGDTNFDQDVFVHDRVTVTTTRRSLPNDGSEPGRGSSQAPAVNADGTVVAFESGNPSLAGGDTNVLTKDVFVRDIDDETVEPVKPVLSVGDAGVPEGDQGTRPAIFSLTLSKPSLNTVTATYATAPSMATSSGDDFKGKSGTVSFAPGTTRVTVKVPVFGDVDDEIDETFVLKVSGVTKAIVGDASAVGTILDDDPDLITGPGLSIGGTVTHEGDSGPRNAVFTVSLSEPRPFEVTVSYTTENGPTGSPGFPSAAAPGDFTTTSGTLTFAPGVTSQAVKVPISTDNVTESLEHYRVVLSGNSAGTALARSIGTGTIVDDD